MTATIYATALLIILVIAIAWPKEPGSFANLFFAMIFIRVMPIVFVIAIIFDLFRLGVR